MSNPANPVARGAINIRNNSVARSLTVHEGHAYLAADDAGLVVFDIRNPDAPIRVGGFKTQGWSMATDVAGQTAFLADRHGGLYVLDVSDPSRPTRLGGFLSPVGVSDVRVVGNLAYLVGRPALQVLDISQPAQPRLIGTTDLTNWTSIDGSGRRLHLAGDLAFVQTFNGVAFNGVEVVDISDPADPMPTGQPLNGARSVFAQDQRAYVTFQEGRLQLFEMRRADPQVLTWEGAAGPVLELDTPHPLQATAGSGLPVSFRVESGPATITDGRLTITGHGTVAVTAEQAGDANFAPVSETRTYNVRQLVLTELGGMTSRNSTADVKVVGDLACVADTTAGLQIINVANPRNPVRVGSHSTGGRASGVDVVENRAYMAIGSPGLQIIDVSDPAQPSRLGTFNTGGTALKVQVVGSRAYVAADTARLQIIDVRTPAQPARLSTVIHAGPARDVQVVGDWAYLAAGTSGLHIIDVSDPLTPVRRGSLAGLGEVTSVRVVGNLAYLAAGFTQMQVVVVDVSNPAAPVRVGGLGLFVPGQISNPYANALDVVDGFAYVSAERSGLHVIDVSNPAQPVRSSIVGTRDMAMGVRWANGRIYLADGIAGLRIIEARAAYHQTLAWTGANDPVLPFNQEQPLHATTASGLPVTLRVETGPATLTNGRLTITGPGLVAVTAEQAGDDRHLPARETRFFNVPEVHWDRLGFFTDLTGEALDMQVVGSRAYVIESGVWQNEQLTGGGLRVLDVSDPRRPVSLGRFTIPGQPGRVAVAGDIACVAAGSTGLHLIDVSNPAAMTRRRGLGLNGAARSVQVAGNLAYVAAADTGLHIIDIGNPAQPVRRSGVVTVRGANDVAVAGDFAYVTEVIFGPPTRSSLHVFDVSVPASPRRVGEVSLPGFEPAVRVVDKVAYVTSWANWSSPESGGLTLIDVSEPSSPVLLSRALTRALASSVDVVGHLAFVGDGSQGGLQVLDVSLPGQPVLVGTYPNAGDARRVQIVGQVAYVAAGYAGFQIIHLDLGLPQSLHWSGIVGAIPTLGTPYPLTVTASSGLPVTVRVASGPATLAEGWLTAHGPGLIQVVAEQPGDAAHLPVRATRSFGLQQGSFDRVGEVHTGGGSRAVEVAGSLAYVLGEGIWNYSNPNFSRLEGGGLRIVDITNPARPTVVGELLMSGRMEDLVVVGNRAYLVDSGTDTPDGSIVDSGLRIVDVTNPASPALLGRSLLDGGNSVSVTGDFAYVSGWAEMHVINVSNPASPVKVATWPRGGRRVRVVNDRAYLLNNQQLEVLDVSEPARPVLLGVQDLAGSGADVQVAGNIAYVTSGIGSETDRRSFFQVFDVSDPARPRLLNELSLSGAGRMWLSGRLAYVTGSTDYRSVVHVLDLSQPDQPVLLGGFRTGDAWDLEIQSGVAYVAGGNGLEVFLLNFRAPQPLRLDLPGRLPFPGTPLAAPASNPSGLPLAFTIASGPARMENQQLIVTGLGPVTLRVEQPGDDRHLPTRIEWTLVVHPPTPRLQVNGTQLELAWPTGLPGLVLLHRETLSPETPWRDLTIPTVEFEGEVRALLEALAPTGLFQLVHP
ncbi:MAG: hypothetical protein HS113_07690 [Verrucomicrobiales bacterium]|nr:hypothetical protein [Verrucomicrobiales bacterium]